MTPACRHHCPPPYPPAPKIRARKYCIHSILRHYPNPRHLVSAARPSSPLHAPSMFISRNPADKGAIAPRASIDKLRNRTASEHFCGITLNAHNFPNLRNASREDCEFQTLVLYILSLPPMFAWHQYHPIVATFV
ncbi:hypothetical protein BGY98DRAFT_34485 [Russula aff. rugulosa BPL654]|nr:hypothetical protein BGY98DRAFT_34485 [Russula aff. rugulosa BPL654]